MRAWKGYCAILNSRGSFSAGYFGNGRSIHHAFVSISRIADRCWCSSLAREYVHTNGTIDQIDFECRCGYRGCRVASECVWASKFHSKLPGWARLISSWRERKRSRLCRSPKPVLDIGPEHALALAEISSVEHDKIEVGQLRSYSDTDIKKPAALLEDVVPVRQLCSVEE